MVNHIWWECAWRKQCRMHVTDQTYLFFKLFILDYICLTVTCYLILTSCSTHHRLTSCFNVYPSEYPYVFCLIDWCVTASERYSREEHFTSYKSCKLNVTMGWAYWWMLLMQQNHGKGGWWIRSDYFALLPEILSTIHS